MSAVTLPPWSSKSLNDYCSQINQKSGHRQDKYLKLLSLIQKAIQAHPTLNAHDSLIKNFTSISAMIPLTVKKRSEVSQGLTQTETVIYQSYLGRMQGELNEAYNLPQLHILEKRLAAFRNDKLLLQLSPDFEKTTVKCESVCRHRMGITTFAHHHNINLTTDTGHESKSKMYSIASLDGGGIRGILPATVLVAIEEITKEPISNLFHLIGGTSTGGILSLGLAKRSLENSPQYSAQQLLDFYTQQHSHIFRRNPYHQTEFPPSLGMMDKIALQVHNPKYASPSPFFNNKFGDAPLSSALTDVLITSNTLEAVLSKVTQVGMSAVSAGVAFISVLFGNTNPSILSHESLGRTVHLFTNQGLSSLTYSLDKLEETGIVETYRTKKKRSNTWTTNPYVLNSLSTHDLSMSFVAQVTSAAPTFFPPVSFGQETFMDGGILQNNPAIPCILQSLSRGYQRENLFMLSLGTGRNASDHHDSSSIATDLWFETTQSHLQTEMALMNMLSYGAYHRIQHQFEAQTPGLDDTSDQTIALLQEAGKELVQDNIDKIRDICKILKPECI